MSGGPFGLSGFPILRDPSTQITSGNEYANQAAGTQAEFSNQIANLPTAQTPGQFATALMQPVAQNQQNMYTAAGFNFGPDMAAYTQNALQNDFVNGSLEQAYASVGGKDNWDSWNRYYNGGAAQAQNAYDLQVSSINAQAAAAAQAAAKADAERQQNQNIQQQAYNQQTGGGFIGGLLNSSYSQPFSNTITGNPGTSNLGMGGGFTGGMMGGGSNAAPSTGLNPWLPPQPTSGGGTAGQALGGMQPPPQAPNTGMAAGWGGPFSNKNAWGLG